MIEKIVSSGFCVSPIIPNQPKIIPEGKKFVNLNPQCGPFPFGEIAVEHNLDENVAIFRAEISNDFAKAQIIPRGRPHFSLLHLALVDDAIASASFSLVTDQRYGAKYRYVELGVMACFHQEAFLTGSLRTKPRGTIFVDTFRIYWQCLPCKKRSSLLQRGIFRISVIGVICNEEIPVVSVEGEYFRRKGVVNVH